jgi:hypothetical protein
MNRIVPRRLSGSAPSACAVFRPGVSGHAAYRLRGLEASHALHIPSPLSAVQIDSRSFSRTAKPFAARDSCPEPSGWHPAAVPRGVQRMHSLFRLISRRYVRRSDASAARYQSSAALSPRALRRASLFIHRPGLRTLKVAHRRERITTACSRRRRGRLCLLQRRRGAAAADAERYTH